MGASASKHAREERLAKEWGYAEEAERVDHCCYFRVYHGADHTMLEALAGTLKDMKVTQGGTLTVTARNEKRTLVSFTSDERVELEQTRTMKDEIQRIMGTDTKVSWVLKNTEKDDQGSGEHSTEIAHEEENSQE